MWVVRQSRTLRVLRKNKACCEKQWGHLHMATLFSSSISFPVAKDDAPELGEILQVWRNVHLTEE